MNATATVMALDAGQSGIRSSIRVDGVERQVGDHRAALTDRPMIPQLTAVAHEAAVSFGAPIDIIGVGSTGLGRDETAKQFLEQVADLGVRQVNLAHDSITSYLGALGNREGVVTAAGTGVVTLAVGAERTLRVDGWGYLVGDHGSGFWIGRAGLDAVMQAFDHRGPATSLTEPVTRDFPSLPDLYLEIQADPDKVKRIASYAKVVAEHAAAGDQVSIGIVRAAGAVLAHSAISGVKAVGITHDDPAVAVLGNVFGSHLVKESFVEHVREAFPAAQFMTPEATGLEGAARVTEVRPGDALFGSILRAER